MTEPRVDADDSLRGGNHRGYEATAGAAVSLSGQDRQAKLSVRRIRKSYGAVVALGETSLQMHEGEFLTLLGPSGSGKTTLLMSIAGLTLPDSGEVWIGGKLATYLPPNRRDIGMVFQNYALFPHMTVGENIGFPLRMRRLGEREIKREVDRSLDIVQLSHARDRLPAQLSGGQQQRVALARCMVYRPSIILMDEPLGALDKKLRDRMQLEIKRLHTELGVTILYVTHDQEEALVMSDRICLMNEGQVEQIGTPRELYFQPQSVFAADFLGESNMLSGVAKVAAGVIEADVPYVGRLRAPLPDHGNSLGPPGSECTLMVRPESVRALGPDEAEENIAEAEIRDCVLVGQVTRLYTRLSSGAEFVATSLTANHAVLPGPGSRVRLGWKIKDTVALLREKAAR